MNPYLHCATPTVEFRLSPSWELRRMGGAALVLWCVFLSFSPSIAAANDRPQPLRIQIPSLPANMPQAEIVDDNLPVQLLDAQMPEPPTSNAQAMKAPAKRASGNLTIGAQAAVTEMVQTAERTAVAEALNAAPPAPTPKHIVITSQAGNSAHAESLPDPREMQREARRSAQTLSVPVAVDATLAAPENERYAARDQAATKATQNTAPASAAIMQAAPTQPFTSPIAAPMLSANMQGGSEASAVLAMPVPTQSPLKNFLHYYPTQTPEGTVVSAEQLQAQQTVISPAQDAEPFATPEIAAAQAQARTMAANAAPQNLAEATESLARTAGTMNPFESDMSSLTAWANQQQSGQQTASAANPEALASLAPAAGGDTQMMASAITSPPVRDYIIIEPLDEGEAAAVMANAAPVAAPVPLQPMPAVTMAAAPPVALGDMPFAVVSKATTNAASASESIAALDIAPQASLSRDSDRLLKRVPSKLDTPSNSKQRIDIDHETKATSAVFSELDGTATGDTASHEAMGIKIEVKKPALDANYEMDRAYNAVLAGEIGVAKESYLRVLQSDSGNVQALFAMGALLHRAGDLTGARQYYAKVLALDPDNRDTLNNFLSLVADEAPEAAISKLKELETRNPDFSPIPAQISYVYQKLGNISQAGQYMLKALSLAPENITYKYNLAVLLDKQGARGDAARFYQELVDAHLRGESIPGNFASIQERLTFLRSNR